MSENKFLDDLAKFGNTTLTAFSGMQRQVRKWVIEQVESMIEGADLVKNIQLQELVKRVEELEKKLDEAQKKSPEKVTKLDSKKTTKKAS